MGKNDKKKKNKVKLKINNIYLAYANGLLKKLKYIYIASTKTGR